MENPLPINKANRIRTNDPEGTRLKIVTTAFDIFVRDGFAATSMLQVRDAAQVTSGALAHHFPSKRSLALAVINQPLSQAIQATWIAPVTCGKTALAGIGKVWNQVADELDTNGSVSGCPLGNLTLELAGTDEEMRSGLHQLYAAWEETIADKLSQDIESGTLVPVTPKALAALTVSAFSGAMTMAKAAQSASPLRDSWSVLEPILRQNYKA